MKQENENQVKKVGYYPIRLTLTEKDFKTMEHKILSSVQHRCKAVMPIAFFSAENRELLIATSGKDAKESISFKGKFTNKKGERLTNVLLNIRYRRYRTKALKEVIIFSDMELLEVPIESIENEVDFECKPFMIAGGNETIEIYLCGDRKTLESFSDMEFTLKIFELVVADDSLCKKCKGLKK